MNDTDSRTSLREAFDQENRQNRLEIRTLIPAKVLAYDKLTQRAEIELSTQTVLLMPDGSSVVQPPVTLEKVPVSWPAVGDGYFHADLKAGDFGMAMVCDRSIGTWRATGVAAPPPFPMPHNLADCVFMPGVRPDTAPLAPPPRAGTTVEGSEINLGAVAALGVARKTDTVAVDPPLAQFTTQVVAAITEIQATLAALGKPPAAPPPTPLTVGQNVCRISGSSDKVKSE